MDIKTLRLCAFRYALGRKTYIVHDMVVELEANWGRMKPYQHQIQEDIRMAIDTGQAGMGMDVKEWTKILMLEVDDE